VKWDDAALQHAVSAVTLAFRIMKNGALIEYNAMSIAGPFMPSSNPPKPAPLSTSVTEPVPASPASSDASSASVPASASSIGASPASTPASTPTRDASPASGPASASPTGASPASTPAPTPSRDASPASAPAPALSGNGLHLAADAGSIQASPLGKPAAYIDQYSAALLFPIGRAENRAALSSGTRRPDLGVDIWTAYELSWLNTKGKPQVATATITVPADSPNIIESKSFKLYLNSLNQSALADVDAVATLMRRDLSAAAGRAVEVDIHAEDSPANTSIAPLTGELLDAQDISFNQYVPDAALLRCTEAGTASEVLVSHLLKSNCPVTGQPDWASVQISYAGQQIDHAQLLRYIVSFRQHAGFHEHCVERIFDDIMRMCHPEMLTVYARYTRRGGLDINPWRSTQGSEPPCNIRTARQ